MNEKFNGSELQKNGNTRRRKLRSSWWCIHRKVSKKPPKEKGKLLSAHKVSDFSAKRNVATTVISGEPRAIRGNMFHRLLLLNRTRDRLPMKVPHKGKKQRHSNLNLGRKRQNSVRGKSLSAEKWQQDQLALEWVAEIDWHLVWKNWTLLDSYSTRIN